MCKPVPKTSNIDDKKQEKIFWLARIFYTFENHKRRLVDSIIVKDLHHYVRQNQLIVQLFPSRKMVKDNLE